MFNHLTTDVW